MCLVVFALQLHPDFPLVVLGNRDEYYARPTASAQPFADAPALFGGRDLQKGGTWLAVSAAGRVAAVTNFRSPLGRRSGRSRGALVREALQPHADPASWMQQLARPLYPSFNLLLGDRHEILGTRASTVVLAHRDGRWRFAERTFGETGLLLGSTDVWLPPSVEPASPHRDAP